MTTLTREEAQQLLDAWDAYDQQDLLDKAIKALRARLAQPEPEPVAWLDSDGFPWSKEGVECRSTKDTYEPLYTAPPQRKEWQGLTDEEIGMLTVFDGLHHIEVPLLAKFVRAIEQTLREKNT